MGLWKNTLVYLGFIEDDIEEDISTWRDPSKPRIIPNPAAGNGQSSDPLASVHALPVHQEQPKVKVIRPRSFADVQRIGDALRASRPVIVNLEGAETELSLRVIAFSCGLVYGLDAGLQKLGRGVYLLNPGEAEGLSHRDRITKESFGS